MLRVAVLVSGGGTNLQALIDQAENGTLRGAELTAVISSTPKAYALDRAVKHGIKTLVISKRDYSSHGEYVDTFLKELKRLSVDLIVLAGFMVILPIDIVREYKNRIINIHPSLIPSFCGEGFYGLRVHEAAIARGVKITGATVHYVDEGCDTGPIILQKPVMVYPEDTPEILQRRVMEDAEWEILPEAVRLIAAGRVCVKENIVHVIP